MRDKILGRDAVRLYRIPYPYKVKQEGAGSYAGTVKEPSARANHPYPFSVYCILIGYTVYRIENALIGGCRH